jgi:phosphohistidine phosphatase
VRIVLLRHGIAVDRDAEDCPSDAGRPLTPRGRARTRAAVAGLAALDVRPRRVATSPFLRARQTAELALELLAPHERDVVALDVLVPGGDPRAVLAWLGTLDPGGDVLCVGHAPNLDLLLALLVGAGRPLSRLRKAGAACVELPSAQPGSGELVWLAPARLLRRRGRR